MTIPAGPPHNAFIGEIAEVMVFGTALDDVAARHVVEVLAEKHGVLLDTNAQLPAAPHGLPVAHDPRHAAALRDGLSAGHSRAETRATLTSPLESVEPDHMRVSRKTHPPFERPSKRDDHPEGGILKTRYT